MKTRPPQSALTRSTEGASDRLERWAIRPPLLLDRPGGHLVRKSRSVVLAIALRFWTCFIRGLWAFVLFMHLRLLEFGDGDYAGHWLL